VLAKTLKFVAQNKVDASQRKFPHENKEDYGQKVYRINDISASKCWYGFSYLKNDSSYPIKENATPELKGFEVIGRQQPFVMEATAGSDDIMILRRTQGDCEFRIPYQLVPRETTEAEVI
jgi:hypothetical protein